MRCLYPPALSASPILQCRSTLAVTPTGTAQDQSEFSVFVQPVPPHMPCCNSDDFEHGVPEQLILAPPPMRVMAGRSVTWSPSWQQ